MNPKKDILAIGAIAIVVRFPESQYYSRRTLQADHKRHHDPADPLDQRSHNRILVSLVQGRQFHNQPSLPPTEPQPGRRLPNPTLVFLAKSVFFQETHSFPRQTRLCYKT